MEFVCSGYMDFMFPCPSTHSNSKGVTSVILEALCRPKHIHEEGGDTHGNIYMKVNHMKAILMRMGMRLDCSH